MSPSCFQEPSAKVRGDAAFELASKLQTSDPANALNAVTQAIVFRRQFYGKESLELREAMDLAKEIQMRIVVQDPAAAPRKRRNKLK